MSLQFLKNDIASKSFRKIYLITGNEPYLKNYYLSAVKNSILTAEEEEFDLTKRDGKITEEEFTETVMAFPMAASKKVFIITDLPLSSPVIPTLISNPDLLSETCCLIIFADTEKYDKKTAEYKKLEKFVKENGLSVTIDTPETPDLVKWVRSYFKKRNTEISGQTAEYFVNSTAPDMYLLKNEMDKLISYKSAEKKVTEKDIDILTTKSVDAKTYELTNAIYEKDFNKAYDICGKLFSMNTYPLQILYAIQNSVASMLKTKVLLSESRTQKQIAEALKIKEYPAKKNCETAAKIPEERLSAMLECCIEADIASKSSAVSPETLVYKLIAECISKL